MPRPLFDSGPERNQEMEGFILFSEDSSDDEVNSESETDSGEIGVDHDPSPNWLPVVEQHTQSDGQPLQRIPRVPRPVSVQPRQRARATSEIVPHVLPSGPTDFALISPETNDPSSQHRERIPFDDHQFHRGRENQMYINWIMFDSIVVLVQLVLILFTLVFIESVLLIISI